LSHVIKDQAGNSSA